MGIYKNQRLHEYRAFISEIWIEIEIISKEIIK